MGMYDNLGDDQVKVFGVSCSPLSIKSKDMNDVAFEPYVMGGNLRYYKRGQEVPYKTPFYNYGKDFIIFDYRCFMADYGFIVHSIKDGKYYRSYSYDKLPKNLAIGLVVDNYGSPLNIHTAGDFVEIVANHKYYMDLYDELREKYATEAGVSKYLPNINEFKAMDKDIRMDYLQKQSKAFDKARDESLVKFSEQWYLGEDAEEYKMINDGFIVGVVVEACLDSEKTHEWDKYKIVQLFTQKIKDNNEDVETYIKNYLEWDKEFDEEVLREIFNKYSQEIPQDVIDSYMVSDIKKHRDFCASLK